MAENLFGINPQSGFEKHVFTYGHLIFAALAITAIILLVVLLIKKRDRIKKVVILASLISLILLEVIKIIYRAVMLTKLGLEINFWSLVDFNFTSLIAWFVVFILLISMFFNKYGGWNKFVYSFVFSVGTIAGLFFFIFPLSLKTGYGFYHILNVQIILMNAVLLFLAIYIGFSYFLEVSVKSFWLVILSLIITLGLVFAIYYISGQTASVMFISGCVYLENIGIAIRTPLQMFIVGGVFFILQILFYLPMQIISEIKMKKLGS